MPKKETATAADTASVEEMPAGTQDATLNHHLEVLRAKALEDGEEQRKVLAAWNIDGVVGEQVLIVSPDGSFKVTGEQK
jgi:hypothetical protein